MNIKLQKGKTFYSKHIEIVFYMVEFIVLLVLYSFAPFLFVRERIN